MPIDVDDFIPARWFHTGRLQPIRLVVLHATQSPEQDGAARAVARYFQNIPDDNNKKASAHVVVDDTTTIGCVHPTDTAFAAPNANSDGYHIEQVGYSEQTTDDWSDPYSQAVIARAAKAAAQACDSFGVPRVFLSPDDVKAGASGVTTHWNISQAYGGTHWDPGPNYPIDRFLSLLNPTPGPTPQPPQENTDMNPTTARLFWNGNEYSDVSTTIHLVTGARCTSLGAGDDAKHHAQTLMDEFGLAFPEPDNRHVVALLTSLGWS